MDALLLENPTPLDWRTRASAIAVSPARLRAVLLTGCALAAAIALSQGSPEAYFRADHELARLLRGMSLIKASLVICALGVLWWRCGHPIGPGKAVAYGCGAVLMAGATALIWQLTLIVPAAVAFHVGGFMLLLTAYVDRDVASSAAAARLARLGHTARAVAA